MIQLGKLHANDAVAKNYLYIQQFKEMIRKNEEMTNDNFISFLRFVYNFVSLFIFFCIRSLFFVTTCVSSICSLIHNINYYASKIKTENLRIERRSTGGPTLRIEITCEKSFK